MSNERHNRTLAQGRAGFAFKKATEGFAAHRKEYAQYAKKLPMMIKTNGLGATLAFMYSKQKTYGTLLADIESWIGHAENKKTNALYKSTPGNGLEKKVTNMSSVDYKAVTLETQAFLNWLRRFAEGLAKEKEAKEKDSANT